MIVVAVRWYLRYGLSYRDVEDLLAARGVEVDHVTVYRWVQRFTPSLTDCIRHYDTARPRRGINLDVPVPPANIVGARLDRVGRVGPSPADQFAVPAQHGRWGDQEDRPAIAGQQLRQRREDHPVGRRVAGPGDLPVQYQQLVA